MSTRFFYALVITICSVVLHLLLYFTGFETEKLAIGQHLGWAGTVATAVVLWLGIKAVRDEKAEGAFSYGQGVGAGMFISLYSGLMNGVYTYIHFKFVNTGYVDSLMELIRTKWAAAGMTEAQMQKSESITRMMMGPAVQGVITPLVTVFIGLIISLVVAAILKRTPPRALSEAETTSPGA